MRKMLIGCVIVVICVWGAFALLPRVFFGDTRDAENDFQAAQMLLAELEHGGESLTFRPGTLDETRIFHALEAVYPYAFSLHCTKRGNSMTVSIAVENKEAQKQAALLAKGIAQELISEDMLLRDRLRVLHDYVVQNCEYDIVAAQNTSIADSSGADAPFTAAGALLNGKAVCAGYARAYMLLCRAAGIDIVYIADEGMNHGWNAVRLYDEIYYIDPTFDDPVPDRGDLVSIAFFLRSKEEFLQTHTWDQDFYNELIDYALPQALDSPQRLYDLGLLSSPPRTQTVTAPLSAQSRRNLEHLTNLPIDKNLSEAQVCVSIWDALNEGSLAREMADSGIFDEVRARQTGISEDVMKK